MAKSFHLYEWEGSSSPVLVPGQEATFFHDSSAPIRFPYFVVVEENGEFYELFTKTELVPDRDSYHSMYRVKESTFCFRYNGPSDSSPVEIRCSPETMQRLIQKRILAYRSTEEVRHLLNSYFCECKSRWIQDKQNKKATQEKNEEALNWLNRF